MWISLALNLLSFLGPILWKLFQDWLKTRLTQKAQALDVEARVRGVAGSTVFRNDQERQVHLLALVRADTWVWQRGKRAAIDQCIEAVKFGGDVASPGRFGRMVGQGAV